MDIPKKITPDSIKQAVIEVKYSTDMPFEVLVGIFFKAFPDAYIYTNRPLKPLSPAPALQMNEFVLNIGNTSLFYNSKISITLMPGAFILSCLNQYIGWKDFQPEVEKALRIVDSCKEVKVWTRVGLRYITEYAETDLKDCLKYSFSFGLPEVESVSTAFRSEFLYDDARVILNLNNKLPVIKQDQGGQQKLIPLSVIDIDIIKEPLQIVELDDLLKVVENLHNTEKRVFFGMLREAFLKSLNPEY